MIEGAEAVALWYQQRWAEFPTFIVTTVPIPLEVYELTAYVSWFKTTALIVNLAIVTYLLVAKRLFGIRGGYARELAERERDVGWKCWSEPRPAPRSQRPRSSACASASRPPLSTGSPWETSTDAIGSSSSGRTRAASSAMEGREDRGR